MPNPTLQGVKWRFLSDAALNYTHKPVGWSEGPKKRIGHLEKALASTHDLEAQYQSFLQEVARTDPSGTIFDGVGPGWSGKRGSYGGDTTSPMEHDIIPSDPVSSEAMMGGISGLHVVEDAEVARVQANAGGDRDGIEAAEHESSRAESPSPVIIWRHSAPVKIATNVPPDLIEERDEPATRGRRAPAQAESSGAAAPPSARQITAPAQLPVPIDPRRAQATAALSRRMAYGVWYLPKEQWEERAFEAGRGELPGGAAAKSASSNGGGAVAGGKGSSSPLGSTDGKNTDDDLTEQIPKLYSSRIYKDYLRSQRIQRLPHYLNRVQSPKPSLSSKRGNIPMIENEASGADGAASP